MEAASWHVPAAQKAIVRIVTTAETSSFIALSLLADSLLLFLVPAEPVSSRCSVTPDLRHNLLDKATKCHLILLINDQKNKSLSDQPLSELKELKEEP